MRTPKISIVVPIYKVEKELRRCVDSLLCQTFKDIEIILVDDCSPDQCPIICDEYAEKDSRVRVIHKENGGLSDARNVGLRESLGEYILFVDSDDYIDIRTCEKFYNSLYDYVDIVIGDAIRIEGERELSMTHSEIPRDTVISGSDFLKVQLRGKKMYMAAWLNLYNKNFLIENDLFFKKGILHEDEQWTPRVFLNAVKVKYIKFPFYYYVIREDSITKKKDKKKNAMDLINTCSELEKIYINIKDVELRKLLYDYLVMLFLNAVSIGNLYDDKGERFYSKSFLIGKPKTIINKLKVILFVFNEKLYRYLHGIYTVRRGNS